MIVSDARIEANRRNALKARGPVTDEGKARSRANALTHGLTAKVLTPGEGSDPTSGPVAARRREWSDSFPAGEGYPAWLVEQVAVVSLKIERADRIEAELRFKQSTRAGLCWDDDRRVEVEALAAGLARDPAEVLAQLKATAHGCDWLVRRWALLAQVAEARTPWTPAQTSLAFDLLGTPHEFRDHGHPRPPVDPDDQRAEQPLRPLDLARDQVAALQARRDELAELDELDQALARADLVDEPSPELRRLRRYQGSLHRQLRWCLAQLKADETAPVASIRTPQVEVEAEPETRAEPPRPEPRTPVPSPVAPVAINPRHLRRREKVEARREAKQRKRERLFG